MADITQARSDAAEAMDKGTGEIVGDIFLLRKLAAHVTALADEVERLTTPTEDAEAMAREVVEIYQTRIRAVRPSLHKLIAQTITAAIARERERCAELAENSRLGEEIIRAQMTAEMNHVRLWSAVSRTIAARIRAGTGDSHDAG